MGVVRGAVHGEDLAFLVVADLLEGLLEVAYLGVEGDQGVGILLGVGDHQTVPGVGVLQIVLEGVHLVEDHLGHLVGVHL